MAESHHIGNLGEGIAAEFLLDKKIRIIDSNYYQKGGEIDLIGVNKDELTIFVEVKSVSCDIPDGIPLDGKNNYRPEEMVDNRKRRKLAHVIEIYMRENSQITDWRVDLICVYIDKNKRMSRVKWLKNIIL